LISQYQTLRAGTNPLPQDPSSLSRGEAPLEKKTFGLLTKVLDKNIVTRNEKFVASVLEKRSNHIQSTLMTTLNRRPEIYKSVESLMPGELGNFAPLKTSHTQMCKSGECNAALSAS
jgi:hypothetical protein